MLEVVQTLNSEQMEELKTILNSLKDNLQPDVSNYAKGRMRFWIEHEWDLAAKVFKPSLKHPRLWEICKDIWPQAQLGLAAFGPIGIKLHRDDSYAAFEAYTINLGYVDCWQYERIYPEYKWVPPNQTINPPEFIELSIKPGDVIRFNCKNRHSPVNPSNDRWSINLWKVSDKFMDAFDNQPNQPFLQKYRK